MAPPPRWRRRPFRRSSLKERAGQEVFLRTGGVPEPLYLGPSPHQRTRRNPMRCRISLSVPAMTRLIAPSRACSAGRQPPSLARAARSKVRSRTSSARPKLLPNRVNRVRPPRFPIPRSLVQVGRLDVHPAWTGGGSVGRERPRTMTNETETQTDTAASALVFQHGGLLEH